MSRVESLITEAAKKPDALGELLEIYRHYLQVRTELRLGSDIRVRASDSDVVQATLMEAVRLFPNFRGTTEPEFTAWLIRINANVIATVGRVHGQAKQRSVHREAPMTSDSACLPWHDFVFDQLTPSKHIIAGERALLLAQAIGSLPDRQREAVRCRFMEGMRVRRIAEAMSTTDVAVASLLKRALKSLREKLDGESWL